MSRHTPLGNGLSRSLQADLEGYEDSELVIHLEPGGVIRLVAEPTNRRLGRGETLPEVKLNAVELFNSRKSSKGDGNEGELGEAFLDGKIKAVLTKVAITYDEGTPSFYHAKVALLKAMREVFLDPKKSTESQDPP